jgi:hypothetical protein
MHERERVRKREWPMWNQKDSRVGGLEKERRMDEEEREKERER